MARLTVVSLALAVAAAMDAFLNTAEPLTTGVRLALTWVPPATDPATGGGMDILHVCGVYSDTIRGHQIGFLLFLLGGPLCALTGAALERRHASGRRRAADWSPYLHAALVFQLSAFGLSGFLFVVLTISAALLEPSALVNPAGAIPLLFVTCNAWGISTWRRMQQERRIVTLALTPQR